MKLDLATVAQLVTLIDGRCQLIVACADKTLTAATVAYLDGVGVALQLDAALTAAGRFSSLGGLDAAFVATLKSDRPDGLFTTAVVAAEGALLCVCFYVARARRRLARRRALEAGRREAARRG